MCIRDRVKWTVATDYDVDSSPAIAADGTVYVGSQDYKLYAITPAGQVKWTVTTGAQVFSSPAIAADGTVYVGSNDGKLYAITAAGQVKWTVTTDGYVQSSPAIAADGTVYVGSNDCKLYAVTPLCGCQTALRGLCAAARNRSSFDCSMCCGAHQRQLQAANCTQGDFQAFCG